MARKKVIVEDTTVEEVIEEVIEDEIDPNLPPLSWDTIRMQRDDMLLSVERMYCFDSPDEIKQAYRDYKQKLRDLPDTYKDLKNLYKIEWPELPNFSQNLNRSRM